MKKLACLILFSLILLSGCAGNYGKIRNLPPSEAQSLTNNFEALWDNYDIRFIPDRALLLIPKDSFDRLRVSDAWVMVANRLTWQDLIRRNITGDGNPLTWFPMTGFRKIEDPSGNLLGFITHARQDLVSVRPETDQTMRLFYSITQISGP